MKAINNIVISLITLILMTSCDLKFWGQDEDMSMTDGITIERYDRLQSRYLSTGDFSALQQMNTLYPVETRTLIENVLQLGTVDQHDINERFLKFYQDSTLQRIIDDVEIQYRNIDDINKQVSKAFNNMQKELGITQIPVIYTQIGALDQSIIVGDSTIGISLDKYLGKDYPVYKRFYNEHQRESMQRKYIVPEVVMFYLLSLYPLQNFEIRPQEERDAHIGKIMWATNRYLGTRFFNSPDVKNVEKFVASNPKIKVQQLLKE